MKTQLLEDLDAARRELLALIEGVAVDTVVYADSGWQLKDILSHLGVWEQQATRSLRAFLEGGSYEIPNPDGDAFNATVYDLHRADPFDDVYALLVKAREDFKAAIAATPITQLEAQMHYPWHQDGPVSGLIGGMAWHDREHAKHIAQVLPPGSLSQ